MSTRSWAFSEDLGMPLVLVVALVLLVWMGLLIHELRRRERFSRWIVLTGIVAMLLTAAAVLRPVRVSTRGSVVGPRVVVLFDQSRRLLLPSDGNGKQTRQGVGFDAVRRLVQSFAEARVSVLAFGEGAPVPLLEPKVGGPPATPLSTHSDLVAALGSLAETPGERPQAIVVLSDGRLTRPTADADTEALRRAFGPETPIHTVKLAQQAPKDASVRAVRAAGAAVAHQPLALTVEVGCAGGLDCANVPITVRELRQGVEPAVLATGIAEVTDGVGTVELKVTLERAGARVVEVAIDAPEGDTIPENDARIMTFVVTRERIRLLHVAGRPTYDVRALRMWLKNDQSVDLVAFFILRTDQDNPDAPDDELALIPFPVNELFTDHLPSFDAVMLQDIDAAAYKFEAHLPALARYVEAGGGLIMVGGPAAFAGGSYTGTDLERVLPVTLRDVDRPFDTGEFVPRYTAAGRAAPVLAPLRTLLADELPTMPGSNMLGPVRPGGFVLWEHPRQRAGKAAMPILALGEAGDGRAIALGIDGTQALAFGELAAGVGGRAYGALWDGLLGWLMRDPRYESARIDLASECIAGQRLKLRLTRVPGMEGDVEIVLERLGQGNVPPQRVSASGKTDPIEVEVGPLEAGGYTARAHIGAAPPTRHDFACERGGEAWADSRPDPQRLERIASVTSGRSVAVDQISTLPLPDATEVAAERHVSPILPPWIWALSAAFALGGHWVVRRRGGLA
jgi:uncharacterized membrane protein